MPNFYLQIAGDPTRWWIADEFPMSELTGGQPLSVTCMGPICGLLTLSPRSASVTVLSAPANPPSALAIPGTFIYVPTTTGPSAGHAGYALAGDADPLSLASQIAGLMHSGHSQSVALSGGGTLVLNGATLPFAITGPVGVGGSTPHG
jgi:hypothetical protein